MSAIAYVKQHPWLVGGVVLVVVGGAYLLFGGSGGTEEELPAGYNPYAGMDNSASIQAGLQLQALQQSAGVEKENILAQKEVALAQLSQLTAQKTIESQTAIHLADTASQLETLKVTTAATGEANKLGVISTLLTKAMYYQNAASVRDYNVKNAEIKTTKDLYTLAIRTKSKDAAAQLAAVIRQRNVELNREKDMFLTSKWLEGAFG